MKTWSNFIACSLVWTSLNSLAFLFCKQVHMLVDSRTMHLFNVGSAIYFSIRAVDCTPLNFLATVCFNQFHLLSNSWTVHLVYESTSDLFLCSTAPAFLRWENLLVFVINLSDFSIVCSLVSIDRILTHCWASVSFNQIHVLTDSRIVHLINEGMSCLVLCSSVLVKFHSVGKFVVVCDTSFR